LRNLKIWRTGRLMWPPCDRKAATKEAGETGFQQLRGNRLRLLLLNKKRSFYIDCLVRLDIK
jgi:hypothetical protein